MSTFDADLVALLPRLRKFAQKLTAQSTIEVDDLIQDTVERALRKRHLFDPAEGRLFAWSCTIMRNLFLNAVTLRRQTAPHVEFREAMTAPVQPDAITKLELRDARRAVNSLPPGERVIFESIAVNDGDYQATADKLGIPVGTVKSRMNRAQARVTAVAR